jgi:aminoglycoside phosphotransferase (APT) family kinase protein
MDELRRQLHSSPSPHGLAAMCAVVEPGGSVTRVRRLGGGLGGATHAVDIRTRGGDLRRLVLKRYAAGAAAIESEWRGLHVARSLKVPSPQPVALDAAGSWFGTAALVMARLPGRAEVNRVHTDGFLVQIAAALAWIHRAPLDPGLDQTIGPRPCHIWAPPSTPPRNSMIKRAHQTIEQLCAIETQPVLIHGDFFSGNLVWSRGRLTGVVDGQSVGRGPREWDLANSRTDLVILSGWRTAAHMLRLYETEAGQAAQVMAAWDLYCGLIGIENFRTWLGAYREQGLVGLNPRQVRSRLLVFVGRALAAVTFAV